MSSEEFKSNWFELSPHFVVIISLPLFPLQSILSTMFYLLEVENEENVLVCLRVIIELHKQFRPSVSPEVGHPLNLLVNAVMLLCLQLFKRCGLSLSKNTTHT